MVEYIRYAVSSLELHFQVEADIFHMASLPFCCFNGPRNDPAFCRRTQEDL